MAPPPLTRDGRRFSKGQVNRAGALLLDLRRRTDRDGPDQALADSDDARLEEAWEALSWWRSLHARPLSTVAANLRYHVDKAGARVEGRIEVTQRLKRLPTIIGKLGREQGNVTQMHDIGGVRAIVPTLRHVYLVRRRLLKSWTIIRERDYIERPKDTGYRALHLIASRHGHPIEVQVRTMIQDTWANVVEESSREFGQDFKFGGGDETGRAMFAAIAEMMAGVDEGRLSSENLRSALQVLPELSMTQSRGSR